MGLTSTQNFWSKFQFCENFPFFFVHRTAVSAYYNIMWNIIIQVTVSAPRLIRSHLIARKCSCGWSTLFTKPKSLKINIKSLWFDLIKFLACEKKIFFYQFNSLSSKRRPKERLYIIIGIYIYTQEKFFSLVKSKPMIFN